MEVLVSTHFVKDFDLGTNGNLYGGRMLDWLDEAGVLFTHGTFDDCFVTWKIGETIFHCPIKAGSIVKIYVSNVDLRESSIGFDLVVRVKDVKVLTTSMVFVCVDPVTGSKKKISGGINGKEMLKNCLAAQKYEPTETPEN